MTELNWKTYDTKKWVINKYAVLDKEIQSLIGGITGRFSLKSSLFTKMLIFA